MSYILTALRKAEKDRGRSASVSAENFLAEERDLHPGKRSFGSPWLLAIVGALLVMIMVYLWATLFSGGGSETVIRPAAVAEKPIEYRQPGPAETKAIATPETPVPVEEAPVRQPAPQPGEYSQPPLPELNITGYIYFENDPGRSKLFVDGIVYRRGSRLAQGLILTGFARDHITVSHHGIERRIAVQ